MPVHLPDYPGLSIASRADTVIQSPVPGTILAGASTSQIITLTAKNLAGDSVVCDCDISWTATIGQSLVPERHGHISPAGSMQCLVVNNISPVSETDNCGVADINYRLLADQLLGFGSG